jgi:hypothetical protein
MQHRGPPASSEWRLQRQREEAFLYEEHLRHARRKNRTLAAMSIVAAACVMLGSNQVIGGAFASTPAAAPVGCGAVDAVAPAMSTGERS